MTEFGIDLPELLAARLSERLPGRSAQRRFSPALSYGRQFAPPSADSRPAAVLCVLYRHGERWMVPMTRRRDDLPDHPGQVCFPGGAVDRGESNRHAALRETHEELGIDPAEVRLVGRLTPIHIFVSNFSVAPFVACARPRPAMNPHPAEVAELLEVPLAHLVDPANRSRHTIRRGRLTFTAPCIQFQTHEIWGATAMILGELASVVGSLTQRETGAGP